MVPVEQSILAPPFGDCMRACVASILERSLDEVPNPHGDNWWDEWNLWVGQFGLSFMNFPLDPSSDWRPPGYWIGAVRCADQMHAVVMEGADMVWNPDPRRAAGVGQPEEATVLVPLDPKVALTPSMDFAKGPVVQLPAAA